MAALRQSVIIGGGITGLACAFRLRQLGMDLVLLEASDQVGGMLRTVRRNGFLFEAGPQSPRFPAPLWKLVQNLGLEDQFLRGAPKAKRFVLKHGRLNSAPFSPGALLFGSLVGVGSKYRILTEVFRSSSPPDSEETLGDFVRRKFGDEVLDYIVDPIISTVFFADANRMGMQSALPALVRWERERGSLVRGALLSRNNKPPATPSSESSRAQQSSKHLRVTDNLPSLGSFKTGLSALPERLFEKLRDSIRLKTRVTSVESIRSANAQKKLWRIRTEEGSEIETDTVVIASPAYAAAAFLNSEPQLGSTFAKIEYAPIAVVSSAYDRHQVSNPLDGFGFMVPRKEGLHTIFTVWNSSLFPARAPEGKVVITSFVRLTTTRSPSEETLKQVAQTVRNENRAILGITGDAIDGENWIHPQALPQYNIGHTKLIVSIEEKLRQLPGLYVAGDYLRGRSLGDCVDTAFQAAEDAYTHLQQQAIQ
jgi:oxygen-dependent protoporphyrinogen oxidase